MSNNTRTKCNTAKDRQNLFSLHLKEENLRINPNYMISVNFNKIVGTIGQ